MKCSYVCSVVHAKIMNESCITINSNILIPTFV